MARWTDVLTAIESGAVSDPTGPFDGPHVLAVDVSGDFAAAFSYSWRQDEAAMEMTFAHHEQGSWVELRTNGPRASGDPLWLWRRTHVGLLAGYQERLDLGNLHLPVLTASAGICGTAVATVRTSRGEGYKTHMLRDIPIRSNLGAFIVLSEGDSQIEVSVLDSDGAIIGAPWPRRLGEPR